MDAQKEMRKVSKKGRSILAKFAPIFFLLGVAIAIVVGLLIGAEQIDAVDTNDTWGYIAATLTGLGFLVGLVTVLGTGTITKDEVTQFLIGAIALVVVGIAGQSGTITDIPFIGDYVSGVTLCMVLFFGPAAIIIALKTLWDLGRD